jgi:hypothetical protein
LEELEEIIKHTKNTPRPYGFPLAFFKKYWPLLKEVLLQILNGFALGILDISRLNFGIISLIPKV